MEDHTAVIDCLLEKPCYVIDVLPKQVAPDAKGCFFDVEYYLLNSDRRFAIKDKFIGVILKLMCYYPICVLRNGWIDRPSPDLIVRAVSTIMECHSGTLNVLFPDQQTLLVFDRDSLNLSVYNPPGQLRSMMETIAGSEGLFWRKAGT